MATRESNPFYIDATVRAPNVFTTFMQGYLGYRVPLAMEWMRARMAAADPTRRQAIAAQMMGQATALRERWASAQAMSERNQADIDVAFKGVLGEAVKLEGIRQQALSGERSAEAAAGAQRYTADTNREISNAEIQRDLALAGLNADVELLKAGQVTPTIQGALDRVNNEIATFNNDYQNALVDARARGVDPEQDPGAQNAKRNLLLRFEEIVSDVPMTGPQREGFGNQVRATLDRLGVADVRAAANDVLGPRVQTTTRDVTAPETPLAGDVANTTRRVSQQARGFGEIVADVESVLGPVGVRGTVSSTETGTSASGQRAQLPPPSPPTPPVSPSPSAPRSGATGPVPHATSAVGPDRYQPLLAQADAIDAMARELMVGSRTSPLGGFYDPIPGGGRPAARGTRQTPERGAPARLPPVVEAVAPPAPARASSSKAGPAPLAPEVAGPPTREERQRRRRKRRNMASPDALLAPG